MAMTKQDMLDYSWVDKWMSMGGPERAQWTADEWKSRFHNLSKSLCYILRHGAKQHGLNLHADASLDISELLAHPQFQQYTDEDINVVVKTNAKKRFELLGLAHERRIRCCQGQSAKVGSINMDLLTQPVTPDNVPKLVIHGTFRENVEPIRRTGLKIMGRVHIHMATGLPNDGSVLSGCRDGANVFLYIDVPAALADGVPFFRSGNDVILSPGVDGVLAPKYIMGATGPTGNILFGRIPGRPLPGQSVPSSDPTPAASSNRWSKGKDSSAVAPADPPASQLSKLDKSFLKDAKRVREILRLEAALARGDKIDKGQADKVKKKQEALLDLDMSESFLPVDSDLRAKNSDVLDLLPSKT